MPEKPQKLPLLISNWENGVTLDDLIDRISDFPKFYAGAINRHKAYQATLQPGGATQSAPSAASSSQSAKAVLPPAEQLSAKGLALISHLYSIRDNSQAQPLIVDSVESLKHMTKLIDNAPVGTNVTLIFQPIDVTDARHPGMIRRYFPDKHRTTLKLEKTDNDVRLIGIDGANPQYSEVASIIVSEALAQNATENDRKPTVLSSYNGIVTPDARQKSDFECGIFATKDARELNREPHFYDSHIKDKTSPLSSFVTGKTTTFKLPPSYLKSSQSTTAYLALLREFGDEVVTQKGKTLHETYAQHGDSYSNHFARKYKAEIEKFYSEHTPEEIQSAIEHYNARNMTAERLVETYGPTAKHVSRSSATSSVRAPSVTRLRDLDDEVRTPSLPTEERREAPIPDSPKRRS